QTTVPPRTTSTRTGRLASESPVGPARVTEQSNSVPSVAPPVHSATESWLTFPDGLTLRVAVTGFVVRPSPDQPGPSEKVFGPTVVAGTVKLAAPVEPVVTVVEDRKSVV